MILNKSLNAFKVKLTKQYVTKAILKPLVSDDTSKGNISKIDNEVSSALPYEKIPGPSKFALLKGFSPGGKFSKMQLTDVHRLLKKDYGDLIRIPGAFGKRDLILTFNPENFEKIYRTEGIWPVRKGLDIIAYYRLIRKKEQFKDAEGLTAVQGEPWAKFRTVVNPVMMQPKTIKIYVPRMDKVAAEFIKRIKIIRDPQTNEVHGTFLQDINHLTLESICVVALDAQLNLINGENNPEAQKLISAMSTFFELIYELDVKPSIWKICKTPTFYRMMNAFDTVTEVATKYIDEAMVRLEKNDERLDNEKSVLERLLKINKKIAITMSMDFLLAGVDTTASAFTSCFLALALNPEKQDNLRRELVSILPEKDSPITNENIKTLPYLRACIKEALRIYPVTIGNFRTTGQDIILNGYQIPKDTDILMSNLLLKKNNLYFENGEKFIPERWLRQPASKDGNKCPNANNNKGSNPFAYLPFGFGPRMCIGRRIVDLELEIGLAKVIRNFHIEYNYPENEVFKTNIINVPKAELKFKFVDVNK